MDTLIRTTPGRVVVVHDYLTQRGGAERVALAIARAFPDARLVTSVYSPAQTFAEFSRFRVETTWLQLIPFVRRDPRLALPMLGPTFERLAITNADVVICSSSGWAHAVKTTAPKIVYCHNPARWLYQPHDYFANLPRAAHRLMRSSLRNRQRRDLRWAASADLYLANSSSVQKRIRHHYDLGAPVLHPPAGITPDGEQAPVDGIEPGFFLTVGRDRGYKNTETVRRAFAHLNNERLVVVGGRPGGGGSRRIHDVGRVTDAQLRWLYAHCTALVAVAYEDFGLTPVEAFLFGRPVIALRAGGYLDTVIDGVTGIFIEDASQLAILDGIERFRETVFSETIIRAEGQRFTEEAFAEQLRMFASELLQRRHVPPPQP